MLDRLKVVGGWLPILVALPAAIGLVGVVALWLVSYYVGIVKPFRNDIHRLLSNQGTVDWLPPAVGLILIVLIALVWFGVIHYMRVRYMQRVMSRETAVDARIAAHRPNPGPRANRQKPCFNEVLVRTDELLGGGTKRLAYLRYSDGGATFDLVESIRLAPNAGAALAAALRGRKGAAGRCVNDAKPVLTSNVGKWVGTGTDRRFQLSDEARAKGYVEIPGLPPYPSLACFPVFSLDATTVVGVFSVEFEKRHRLSLDEVNAALRMAQSLGFIEAVF